MVSVVMYHYVRDVERTPYPGMYARSTAEFGRQLDYLQENFEALTHDCVVQSFTEGSPLKEETFFLTFDDGLKDHYLAAVRELNRRQLEGSFYVPSDPLRNATVLDVHKLQMLLGSQEREALVASLTARLGRTRFDSYRQDRSGQTDPSRYDDEEVLLFKRLLQRDLEQPLRSDLVDALFREFIHTDVREVSRELYLSVEELRDMKKAGMTIGSHTNTHPWLTSISESELTSEILSAQDFLEDLGLMDARCRTIAYPYGDHDDSVVELLEKENYSIAFTTVPRAADPTLDRPLRIPRLDTNDFPR